MYLLGWEGRCESGLLLFSSFFLAKTVHQFVLSPVVFRKSKDYKPEFIYIYIFDTSCIECVPVFGLLFLSIQDNFSLDVGL